MGYGQTERERLVESDFPILESMTKELQKVFLEKFSVQSLETENWPFRYLYSYKGCNVECIFSAMGSFTVRLAKDERYRRNPPPLFYMSVGKYSGNYVWENGGGDEIVRVGESLTKVVHSAIEKYLASVSN